MITELLENVCVYVCVCVCVCVNGTQVRLIFMEERRIVCMCVYMCERVSMGPRCGL
jgi:hypothetical protein